jgi:adenylosuccinate lyase
MVKLLGKIEVNEQKMLDDLNNNPEVLAEAIQTVLRKNGRTDAYEVMKEMTRGQHVTLETLREFIAKLDINEDDKQNLLKLEPANYIGRSSSLVEEFCDVFFSLH